MLGIRFMSKKHGGNGGTIVNIASILGLSPMAGCPVYCGTKHAVVGFTTSWAVSACQLLISIPSYFRQVNTFSTIFSFELLVAISL